jgi:ATP-binding cassette subfamily F protein 3
VQVAYYAQHVAERLRPDDSVFDAMSAEAPRETTRQEILDLAGSLLFSGDDVEKKIRVLSGGEKSRVALGRMLLKKCSLLLLDEPTNHLDFHTVEALTQALASYAGAFVIVSHDRGFVGRTASKILEIHDGRADYYPGTYDEYVWSVQKGALSQREVGDAEARSGAREISVGQAPAPLERFNYKERKKFLEKELRTCEKETARLDREMNELKEKVLSLTDELLKVSGPAAAAKARELGDVQGQIEKAEGDYLAFLERHEAATEELQDLVSERDA